jgi:hypothetical protein
MLALLALCRSRGSMATAPPTSTTVLASSTARAVATTSGARLDEFNFFWFFDSGSLLSDSVNIVS